MGLFKKLKDKKDKAKFNDAIESFEAKNFKKCGHCGENVPKGDNICQSCNQIP